MKWVRLWVSGGRGHFDDPVSKLPDEAHAKLVKEFEERKHRAEVMLQILQEDAEQ